MSQDDSLVSRERERTGVHSGQEWGRREGAPVLSLRGTRFTDVRRGEGQGTEASISEAARGRKSIMGRECHPDGDFRRSGRELPPRIAHGCRPAS